MRFVSLFRTWKTLPNVPRPISLRNSKSRGVSARLFYHVEMKLALLSSATIVRRARWRGRGWEVTWLVAAYLELFERDLYTHLPAHNFVLKRPKPALVI